MDNQFDSTVAVVAWHKDVDSCEDDSAEDVDDIDNVHYYDCKFDHDSSVAVEMKQLNAAAAVDR